MYFSTRASTYLFMAFQTFMGTLLLIFLMVHDFDFSTDFSTFSDFSMYFSTDSSTFTTFSDFSNTFLDFSNTFLDFSNTFSDFSITLINFSNIILNCYNIFSDFSNTFSDFSNTFSDFSNTFSDYCHTFSDFSFTVSVNVTHFQTFHCTSQLNLMFHTFLPIFDCFSFPTYYIIWLINFIQHRALLIELCINACSNSVFALFVIINALWEMHQCVRFLKINQTCFDLFMPKSLTLGPKVSHSEASF